MEETPKNVPDDVPKGWTIQKDTEAIVDKVTTYGPAVEGLRLWLLGWRLSRDGKKYVRDEGTTPVMNEDGVDAYCSLISSLTRAPVSLSKHEHNEVVRKIKYMLADLRADLVTYEDEWGLDWSYVNTLVNCFDVLATAALNGSIDGFTIQKVTEHLMISERRGVFPEEKGNRVLNLLRRNKSGA